MTLLELVIICIKNVVRDDNDNFNIEMTKEDFDSYRDNPNYADYINNVEIDINQALARLSTSEKLPRKLVEFDYNDVEKNNTHIVIELKDELNQPIKDIFKVKRVYFSDSNGIQKAVRYSLMANGKLLVKNTFKQGIYNVEYSRKIPMLFLNVDYKVDLNNVYDIDDNILNSYVVNYVKGKLWEQEEPTLSKNYFNFAEQYLSTFSNDEDSITQTEIEEEYSWF